MYTKLTSATETPQGMAIHEANNRFAGFKGRGTCKYKYQGKGFVACSRHEAVRRARLAKVGEYCWEIYAKDFR